MGRLIKKSNNENYKSLDNGYEVRFEKSFGDSIIFATVVCHNEDNEYREDFECPTGKNPEMLLEDVEDCLLRRVDGSNLDEVKQVINSRHKEWCEFLGIDSSLETFMDQYDIY